MGFLSVIRRWALRDKMPIREIARLSRAEIDRIGQAFEPHQELLAHFGYDLIASSGG